MDRRLNTETLSDEPYLGFTNDLVSACEAQDKQQCSKLLDLWKESPNIESERRHLGISINFFAALQAIGIGQMSLVRYLVEPKKLLKKEARWDLRELIYVAVTKMNIEALDHFYEHYKRMVNRYDLSRGMTFLGMAAKTRNVDLVKWFLDRGADPNRIPNEFCRRALELAVSYSTIEIVKMLLDAGGCPTKGSLLHLAITNRETDALEMVQLLLSYRADVNIWAYVDRPFICRTNAWKIECGQYPIKQPTPLHLAVIHEKIDILEVLLQHGADQNLKDISGLSSLELAEGLEDIKVLEIFQRYSKAKENDSSPTEYAISSTGSSSTLPIEGTLRVRARL